MAAKSTSGKRETHLGFSLKEFQRLWEQHPDSLVFAPLADALREFGDLDGALSVCRAGLEKHPHYLGGLVALGKLQAERGETDEARDLLERVLTHSPHNYMAAGILREIYRQTDEQEKLSALEGRFAWLLATGTPSGLPEQYMGLDSFQEMGGFIALPDPSAEPQPAASTEAQPALSPEAILEELTAQDASIKTRPEEAAPQAAAAEEPEAQAAPQPLEAVAEPEPEPAAEGEGDEDEDLDWGAAFEEAGIDLPEEEVEEEAAPQAAAEEPEAQAAPQPLEGVTEPEPAAEAEGEEDEDLDWGAAFEEAGIDLPGEEVEEEANAASRRRGARGPSRAATLGSRRQSPSPPPRPRAKKTRTWTGAPPSRRRASTFPGRRRKKRQRRKPPPKRNPPPRSPRPKPRRNPWKA